MQITWQICNYIKINSVDNYLQDMFTKATQNSDVANYVENWLNYNFKTTI